LLHQIKTVHNTPAISWLAEDTATLPHFPWILMLEGVQHQGWSCAMTHLHTSFQEILRPARYDSSPKSSSLDLQEACAHRKFTAQILHKHTIENVLWMLQFLGTSTLSASIMFTLPPWHAADNTSPNWRGAKHACLSIMKGDKQGSRRFGQLKT
jgi:hypothetical protein